MKNKILRLSGCFLISWMLFMISFTLSGSAQVISVDTLTATPSSRFPFDVSFPLKYSVVSGTKISQAILFKISSAGCKEDILSKSQKKRRIDENTIILNKQISQESDAKRIAYYKKLIDTLPYAVFGVNLKIIRQSGNDVYLQMPALQANARYHIYLKSNPEMVEGIDSVLKLLAVNDYTAAKAGFDVIQKKYIKDFSHDYKCKKGSNDIFKPGDFELFLINYNNGLRSSWSALSAQNNILKTLKKEPTLSVPKQVFSKDYNAVMKSMIKFSEECNVCLDSIQQYKLLLKHNNGLLPAFSNLQYLSLPLLSTGRASLVNYRSIVNDPSIKPEQRILNLSSSVLTIQAFQALLDYYVIKYNFSNNNLTRFSAFLADGLQVYTLNLDSLQNHQKAIAKQNELIKPLALDFNTQVGEYFSFPVTSLGSDTYTYNFVTRAGYRIKTDFGFMAYGNPWNNPNLKGFLPYVGFHVNLRPMNTDIPFSQIPNKDIWSYLSINAGVLIGSLKEEGKRDGLIGGTSVFTGLGVNFSHEFRIVFGGVWFRKLDPNPLIDHKTVAATPFIGLSIDFRLEDIYKGVKKIFEP